jgi:hypothetical protein
MVAAIPALIKIAFLVLEYLAHRKGVTDESKRIFIKLAEDLRRLGLADVRSRYEAEEQLKSNDAEWEKRHEQRKS